MWEKTIPNIFVIALLLVSIQSACTVQRCCYASTCSNTYCQSKNSETWISTQNFATYGYTKLVQSSGSCLPCSYNCQACTSQTTCSTCASGFYMSNSKCVICGYMCSSCVVINSISKCSVCSGATYLDSSSATCKNCATGAAFCSSANVISACNSGYYLTSNSMFCLACPSNCQSCPSSNTICSSCNTGFYLNSSQCYACTKTNCSSCSYFSGAQYCIGCISGSYASGGNCDSCSTNCNKCTSGTNCLTCSSGYYLISGGCLPAVTAIDNCNTYQNSTACSTCAYGYYLSNIQCYPCSILCSSCYGLHFGQCTACKTNTNLYNQMCLPDKYLSNSIYQLYFSFPSANSFIQQGSQDCNHYLYSGTTVSLTIKDLSSSKVTIKWRLFSVMGSTSYNLGWTNTAGTQNFTFITSSSQGQAFPLCTTNSSFLYYLHKGEQDLSTIKITNTLSFSTNNGVSLAVQEVLLVVQMCNSLCIECSDTACTQCLMSNLYTQDAYCVYTCSSGYYIYENITNTNNQNSCVQQCPTGTYALSTNLSCVQCTSPCFSCMSQVYCLSCIADYYLTQENTCLQVCPYRYFGQVLTQTCQKCVGRCNECLDQQRCLNCNSGFFYAANYSCLDSCDPSMGLTGMYANLSTLTCQSCSSSCLNCLLQSTYCTSCKPGFIFYNSTCLNACPTGYYSNNASICVACQYPCQSCSIISSNCTSCQDGYLFNNNCISDCPVSYFEDNTVLSCTACLSSCLQCIYTSSYCTQCQTGYFLFNNTCLSACPDQFYANTTSKICQACVGHCYTCLNDTYCTSCSSNFLLNGQCVSSINCPNKYYAEINQLSCLSCNSNCLTCQYSSTYCTSCNLNSSASLLENNICVSSCSSTFVFAGTLGGKATCVSCVSPCQTCTNETYCLSCVQGYMLSGGSCSTSCSASYYFDTTTTSCIACSLGCLSCNNGQFCQVCQTGKYIRSINSTSNQCVSNCGSQFYISLVSGSCRACIYPCLDCTSNIQCLSCQQGALYQNRCVSTCPDTTYLNSTSSICEACGANCLTCSQTSTHCSTCQTAYFLSTIDNTCNLVCPSATYAQNVTQMCLQCSSTCSSCTNSTYCLSCIANKTYLYSTTHICLSDCPLGYFANTASTTCDSCNSKCLTCSGSASNCLSCSQNYYLVRLTVSTYDCVTSCPQNYYQQSQNCEACIFPCQTCSSATACLTCVLGTYYYSSTSACLLACPSNTYLNNAAQSCTLCSNPCASCRSNNYCLSCLNNLYLQNGQCVASCPDQYYSDSTKICTQCSGLCKTCSSKYFCLSCLTGYLSNGYCYSSCPAGTFANLTISACQPCLSPCLECTFSTSYCTRCTGGLVQYQGNCSSSCPLGTYLSDGSCLSCQFPCTNCSGPQLCTECLGGYLLYNGMTCINETTYCPNDLYKMDGKYCIPKAECPISYYTDSDLKTCSSSCSPAKYLYTANNSCLYSCQNWQYAGAGMVCQNFSSNPPISLMGMTAISFIKSNIMNIVVSFNESATWMSGATNLYLLSSTSAASSRMLAASSIQYNMDSGDMTNLILKVSDLPNQISFSLPANNVVSSSSSYPLQTPNITLSMPSYVTYDYSTIYQGMLASQFGSGLGWFILLLSVFYLFKNRISHLYTLWDTVQLLYVIILLQIQYPPPLNQFLVGLKTTLFLNFPNIFKQDAQRTSSSRPFYAYTYDNNFLRNAGPSLTIGIIVIIIYLLFKIMAELNRRVDTVKGCMANYPKLKRFMYETLLRFRWHYVSDVFFLTYLSVFLFAVAEMYHLAQNPGRIFSNALCVICLILYSIFPIFAGIKLHRHFPNIKKGKHSQNLRCFYRGIDKTSQFGVFLIMIRYFRKICYALVIGIFSSQPMYALPILMFTSVLMALFIFLNLPFKKRLSNIVEIINECCIAFLFLGIALINFNNQQKFTSFNIALGYACTGLLIFILLLLVFQVFCRSLFRLKSEEEIRNENEKKMEEMSESELRRKAGQFFDFIFPRLKKQLGLGDDSDDQSYKYQEGDSQNSQNNLKREQEWGIENEEQDQDQFRHYGGSQSQQVTQAKKKAPEYLIRCVKELK